MSTYLIFLPLVVVLLLSGCATTPDSVTKPMPVAPVVRTEPGGRYNHLHITVVPKLPERLGTVESALRWLLEPTGYRLVGTSYLTLRPLSPLAQSEGLLTVEQAALRCIGQENALVVDHAARKVAVQALPPNAEIASRVITRAILD